MNGAQALDWRLDGRPLRSLALLLAGPALSLPNMLVIATVLGWRKTLTYVGLVVALSALAGLVYGNLIV